VRTIEISKLYLVTPWYEGDALYYFDGTA